MTSSELPEVVTLRGREQEPILNTIVFYKAYPYVVISKYQYNPKSVPGEPRPHWNYDIRKMNEKEYECWRVLNS